MVRAIDGGKEVRHKHVLTLGAARVDQRLEGGAEDRHVGAIGEIGGCEDRGVRDAGRLADNNVRCRHLGEDHVQQRGHIVRRHKVRVAPAAHVVDAQVNQEQVGVTLVKASAKVRQGVVGGRGIAMSGGQAGISDDRSVHAFVARQGKGRSGGGEPTAQVGERVAVGLQQRLQVGAPGAVNGAVIGDRVARRHHLEGAGGGVIGQHQLRSQRRAGQRPHQGKPEARAKTRTAKATGWNQRFVFSGHNTFSRHGGHNVGQTRYRSRNCRCCLNVPRRAADISS